MSRKDRKRGGLPPSFRYRSYVILHSEFYEPKIILKMGSLGEIALTTAPDVYALQDTHRFEGVIQWRGKELRVYSEWRSVPRRTFIRGTVVPGESPTTGEIHYRGNVFPFSIHAGDVIRLLPETKGEESPG